MSDRIDELVAVARDGFCTGQMHSFHEHYAAVNTLAATARRLAEKLADHHGCPSNSRDYCDCATCDPDADEAEHLATSAKCWIRIAEADGL